MTEQERIAYERLAKHCEKPITGFGSRRWLVTLSELLADLRKAQILFPKNIVLVPERWADMTPEKKREDAAVNWEEELLAEVQQRFAEDSLMDRAIKDAVSREVSFASMGAYFESTIVILHKRCVNELVARLDELDPVAAKEDERDRRAAMSERSGA